MTFIEQNLKRNWKGKRTIRYKDVLVEPNECLKSVLSKIHVPERTKWLSPIVQTTFYLARKKMLFLFLTFFRCMSMLRNKQFGWNKVFWSLRRMWFLRDVHTFCNFPKLLYKPFYKDIASFAKKIFQQK